MHYVPRIMATSVTCITVLAGLYLHYSSPYMLFGLAVVGCATMLITYEKI